MYIKNPFEANLLQRGFREFAFIKPMDIDHLLRYMAQTRKQLIFPIVSTEREPITFRRRAFGVICIILRTCTVQQVYQCQLLSDGNWW